MVHTICAGTTGGQTRLTSPLAQGPGPLAQGPARNSTNALARRKPRGSGRGAAGVAGSGGALTLGSLWCSAWRHPSRRKSPGGCGMKEKREPKRPGRSAACCLMEAPQAPLAGLGCQSASRAASPDRLLAEKGNGGRRARARLARSRRAGCCHGCGCSCDPWACCSRQAPEVRVCVAAQMRLGTGLEPRSPRARCRAARLWCRGFICASALCRVRRRRAGKTPRTRRFSSCGRGGPKRDAQRWVTTVCTLPRAGCDIGRPWKDAKHDEAAPPPGPASRPGRRLGHVTRSQPWITTRGGPTTVGIWGWLLLPCLGHCSEDLADRHYFFGTLTFTPPPPQPFTPLPGPSGHARS